MQRNILIVDDIKINLVILRKMLKEYEIYTAKNKKEMLKILEIEKIDLILLDIMMPKEDGMEIAKQLKKNKKYKNIPIVFVTAKTSDEDLEIGLELAEDYIEKPVKKGILLPRIKKVLRDAKAKEKLFQKISKDFLTDLYTREYLETRMKELISHYNRNGKILSFAMLDIDKFKEINDEFGHLAGDYILKLFSREMRDAVREYDIVARYGGDEFIIVFIECDKKMAVKILNRIKTKLSSTNFDFNSEKINFNFSSGVSEISEIKEEVTLRKLLELSDKRLYKAKGIR